MGWFEDVQIWREGGDLLSRQGKYAEALALYRRALAHCPGEAGTASIEEDIQRRISRCENKVKGRAAKPS
ncbi:MAG: hypothetical protein A2289_07225 [Deltaproteobacteria bacterium RIFOXYA12_FULL_58_15]|nr:MAG: hypothetical protein A2289_07225 [Deltaproteobacteria bacterium RIFOXYA12_FULL_58_15]